MNLTRRTILGSSAAGLVLPRYARAQKPTIKIGVLNDQSGPYRDDGGPTGVVCTKQALEDFGISGKGWEVEVRHRRWAWRSTPCAAKRTRSI
jgi:branched-chain amino acid transport system substrate-binding protein